MLLTATATNTATERIDVTPGLEASMAARTTEPSLALVRQSDFYMQLPHYDKAGPVAVESSKPDGWLSFLAGLAVFGLIALRRFKAEDISVD